MQALKFFAASVFLCGLTFVLPVGMAASVDKTPSLTSSRDWPERVRSLVPSSEPAALILLATGLMSAARLARGRTGERA